jgi:hypothetical protein
MHGLMAPGREHQGVPWRDIDARIDCATRETGPVHRLHCERIGPRVACGPGGSLKENETGLARGRDPGQKEWGTTYANRTA